ncbi:VOC family protein [Streptomyces arenae]|uniref:VOC family protein n=1 Tax=Streptomyces arenae TaxID=29301 RepID=UPI00265B2625|nr:VOC family protein [Streptomyces arenae]MCG7210566.1 VOC family protein [Streptomyces arenae]
MAENRAAAYAEGVPCWVDVQLPDVEAGKRFYGDLFGWSFENDTADPADGAAGAAGGGSAWARLGGADVARLARKTDGRMPTAWTVFFATPDAGDLCRRVLVAGGTVVTAPAPVRDLGTAALVADPQGAVFGVWQAGAHRGFGVRHAPGTFAWAQLYTSDTDAANAFYARLFHDALFGAGADPDFGRAPVTEVFAAGMPSQFVVHFRTGDVEAATGAVRQLGGRVQAPPFETSYGKVAVVTDNQGASFALLQR